MSADTAGVFCTSHNVKYFQKYSLVFVSILEQKFNKHDNISTTSFIPWNLYFLTFGSSKRKYWKGEWLQCDSWPVQQPHNYSICMQLALRMYSEWHRGESDVQWERNMWLFSLKHVYSSTVLQLDVPHAEKSFYKFMSCTSTNTFFTF